MATEVTFTLPDRKLGKADIQFLVKRNRQVVGKLLVSKGAVVWRPKYKQKGTKVGWLRFDKFMNEYGRPE